MDQYTGPLDAGPNEFEWDGRDRDGVAAASGVYFVKARHDGGELVEKVMLVK